MCLKPMQLCYVFFFILNNLLINSLQAQWIPPSQIKTPYGNATIPGYHISGASYFFLNNKGPVNGKYDYTIVLLNDSTITKKTRLKIDFKKNHSSITWNQGKDKKIITPKETKEIYRMVLGQTKLTGIAIDSTWIFLIDKGRIQTYSVTSDFREPTIAYFQYTATGDIQALTKENLLPFVADDNALVKLVNKNKLLEVIKKYNNKIIKEEASLYPNEPKK